MTQIFSRPALALAVSLLAGHAMAQSTYITVSPGQIIPTGADQWLGGSSTFDVIPGFSGAFGAFLRAYGLAPSVEGDWALSESATSPSQQLVAKNASVTGTSAFDFPNRMIGASITPGALVWTSSATVNGTGGTARLGNLKVDFEHGWVMADLSGTKAAVNAATPAQIYSPESNQIIWTFLPGFAFKEVITGTNWQPMPSEYQSERDKQNPPWGPITKTTFSVRNLQLTAKGEEFFINSLGITNNASIRNVNTQGWGNLTVTNTFMGRMPEPSTYACMGIGLVGVALAARRQQKQH